MNKVFSTFLLFSLIVTILSFGTVVYAAPVPERAQLLTQDCSTIDKNWKEYGQNILGANRKISDVVLNACNAIGGGCTFNSGARTPEHNAKVGGAKNSQHIQKKAIDLRVGKGYEKAFITLAICGLKKVNNCQGGIGMYSSGAIHIDVRQGANNVWSDNYSRSSIPTGVSDPEARNILYGFGDGKCKGGSITGSYTEKALYGPLLEYTPPNWLLPNISYPSERQKNPISQLLSALFSGGYKPSVGGGDVFTNDPFVDPLKFSDETLGYDSTLFDGGEFGYNQGDSTKLDYFNTSIDSNLPNECNGSNFFGIKLFNTCDSGQQSVNYQPINTVKNNNKKTVLQTFSPTNIFSSLDFFGQVYEDSPEKIGDSQAVFYGTHNPGQNTGYGYGRQYQQQDTSGTGQFIEGEQRIAFQRNPEIIKDSLRFAKLSARFGAYYGLIHGLSPMIIGSAPRVIFRIEQQINTN